MWQAFLNTILIIFHYTTTRLLFPYRMGQAFQSSVQFRSYVVVVNFSSVNVKSRLFLLTVWCVFFGRFIICVGF